MRPLQAPVVAAAGAVVLVGLLLGFPGSAGARPQEPAAAAEAAPRGDGSWVVVARHPGDGEQCLVCRKAIHDEPAVEIRWKGRVFHVKESMLDDFRADPEAYFRRLQAHSGLFDEEAMPEEPLRTGWLVFGVYLVLGLVLGAVCGSLALARSRPALRWFLFGLVANVLALLALLAVSSPGEGEGAPAGLGKLPSTREPRSCPHCGAANHPAAATCTSCGGALEPRARAETDLVPREAR